MSAHVTTTGSLRLSRRGQLAAGQPISDLMSRALAYPNLISLAAGFVDQPTLPAESTRAALEDLFADGDAARVALQYGTTPGYPPLREALLQRMRSADHALASEARLSVEQVVVTAGSNQLLHLVCDTLLDPGDIVLCAAPTYFVFLGLLTSLGARSVGVTADADGMIPEALEETLGRLDDTGELSRVKAIYVTSYFDNPSSVSLAAERRPAVVEIAKRWSRAGRIHVIEDSAYRELRYEGEDLPSLRAFDPEGETVVVAGTFSKSYAPGIRIGWGVLPPELVEPICDQKGNFDFGTSNFSQHLMHRVLEQGLFEGHVASLRTNYRAKLQAMLEGADRHFGPLEGVSWIRPRGGLYVWVTLPESIDAGMSGTLFGRAVKAGVLYVPGEHCFPSEGERKKNTIRLSFGVQPVEKIRLGMEHLAEAIRDELG